MLHEYGGVKKLLNEFLDTQMDWDSEVSRNLRQVRAVQADQYVTARVGPGIFASRHSIPPVGDVAIKRISHQGIRYGRQSAVMGPENRYARHSLRGTRSPSTARSAKPTAAARANGDSSASDVGSTS
jgi:hypothetical protein